MRLAIVVLSGCTAVSADRPPAPTPPPASPTAPIVAPAPRTPAGPKSCVDDGKPYTEAALRAHLGKLADPTLDGRAPGTDGDRAARAYIAQRFRCLGLSPGGKDGSFEQPFAHGKAQTANVVAYRKGTDPRVGDEIVVVGAHHDHLGNGHLGANDNASGVAGVLAIAQAVAAADAPKRTIAFVTFGAEEAGLVGSQHFVANPPSVLPLDKVVQYVNLDMIGSHASRRVVYAFGAFAKLPSRAVLAKLDDSYPELVLGLGGHSVRGDQYGFCKAGIPYVFFWTPDARCYHETCDTVDRLDVPRMADIVALAGGLVGSLAATETDLAAARAKLGCRPR